MELSIDTSTRYASVVIAQDGYLLRAASWHSKQNHTMELAPWVETLVSDIGMKYSDFKSVSVAGGPGGFSALRVGLSFAKGLAESLQVPLVAVSSLSAEALPYLELGYPVCPLIPLGRGQFAFCLFAPGDKNLKLLLPENVGAFEAITASVSPSTVFCGEGIIELVGTDTASGNRITDCWMPGNRAWSVLKLGLRNIDNGTVPDIRHLEPNYLRQPSIGGVKEENSTRR